MAATVFHIHSRADVFESPLSPSAFGTDNWGKVNRFHQLAPDAPIGEGPRFEQGAVYEAFHAVFVEGQPWEATRWFKYNLSLIRKGRVLWHCRTGEELLKRLNHEVRALYASIARHGFLRQEQIAERAQREPDVFARFAGDDYHSSLSPSHEIKVGVNENGRLLFLDGRHRLAIAKLLGIVRIPVRVVFVHPAYVRQHRPEALSDSLAMAELLAALFDRLATTHGQPTAYITQSDYLTLIKRIPDGPAKNAPARWDYYKSAIDFVRLCKPVTASEVLEIGARGVPIVKGSDTLEPTGQWAGEGNGLAHRHDPGQLPWPLADRRYEVVVALRVFQHLWPRQRECFLEARRVGRNLVMVVPEHYDGAAAGVESTGITEHQLTEWNDGVAPTVSVRLPGWVGKIYFWNQAALGGSH
jgi:hypothetical protein